MREELILGRGNSMQSPGGRKTHGKFGERQVSQYDEP